MENPFLNPPLLEECIYDIPLWLEAGLEPQRSALRSALLAAQRRLREFAARQDWLDYVREPFARHARFYSTKPKFDHDLLQISHLDPGLELPPTYCAALENNILYSVSPELYRAAYPQGEDENYYEKLLAHEMAHRLHIRILKGDEEAMGPLWFYEGFALYAAGQFEQLHALLQARYPKAHAVMQREVVGGASLLYTWQGSDPSLQPILLMAHQDVVPIAPGTEADWAEPPFGGAVKNGFVWGRGAWDDKGNLIAQMEAIEMLLASGFLRSAQKCPG